MSRDNAECLRHEFRVRGLASGRRSSGSRSFAGERVCKGCSCAIRESCTASFHAAKKVLPIALFVLMCSALSHTFVFVVRAARGHAPKLCSGGHHGALLERRH